MKPRMLNIGCGRRIHPDWTNIDLVSSLPGVMQHDIRRGLPFEDHAFDAAYHSHLLEHLAPEAAKSLLLECHRVLKPNATLRVAVPDLERIAREYLATIDRVDAGDSAAAADHRWMTIELIDQLTRHRSGGTMVEYLTDARLANRQFVLERMGAEFEPRRQPPKARRGPRRVLGRETRRFFRRCGQAIALVVVQAVAGANGREAYREAVFRASGEVHRWMYDRISLANLLREVGFVDVQVRSAGSSRIDGFATHDLEVQDSRVLKPDSLFMEAVKAEVRQRHAA